VAINALGGAATNEELLEKVIEIMHLPVAVQNLMHNERYTKVGYNLAWARTFLGKTGALENHSIGVWAILSRRNGRSDRQGLIHYDRNIYS
jgi:restriction system protein